MRFIGALLLLFAGTLYGAGHSYQLYQRVAKLERVLHFLNMLCEEIRLTRAELPTVLSRLPHDEEYIEDGVWHGLEGMAYEDMRILESFLLGLGKSDLEGQMNHARLHIDALAERLIEAKDEKRRLSKLYMSLGIAGGLFAVVLVI